MARPRDIPNDVNRPGPRPTSDRDDDRGSQSQGRPDPKPGKDDHSSGRDDDHDARNQRDDSHPKQDPHERHESCESGRGDDDHDRYAVDLDKRHDGIDLEIDVERDGRWLEVKIEIGSLDIDLKLDARHLQPDTNPVVAMVGGEGTAVGEETLVDANIFSRLIDLGSVTVAFGTVDFKSAAVSQDGLVFAASDTFAEVSGADLVFVFSEKVSTSGDGSVSYATDTSTTSFIAIDFEDFDFAEGPLVLNAAYARAYLDQLCGKAPALDGNVSMLDVDALALADNTLVDVLTSILTIQDQLSSVSVVTVSAVG